MLNELAFADFKPTWEFERYVKTSIQFLLGLAPYGAVGNLNFERAGSDFICFVEVLSRWGHFINHSRAECPREALDQACLNIRNQLHRISLGGAVLS